MIQPMVFPGFLKEGLEIARNLEITGSWNRGMMSMAGQISWDLSIAWTIYPLVNSRSPMMVNVLLILKIHKV